MNPMLGRAARCLLEGDYRGYLEALAKITPEEFEEYKSQLRPRDNVEYTAINDIYMKEYNEKYPRGILGADVEK